LKSVKNLLGYVLTFIKDRLGDILSGFVFLVADWNYYLSRQCRPLLNKLQRLVSNTLVSNLYYNTILCAEAEIHG